MDGKPPDDRPTSDERRPNHLAGETSPYLLQHLYNPVDWYAWGAEPIERARRESKPLFVSIGYAACHWCHVMERESFEDAEVAAFLNEHFVSIKIDREERPDIDEIYMTAVQLMTGQGGWPLNVFLTPDLRPFFGGTYFPPDQRYGRPDFLTVLRELKRAWDERRADIDRSANGMTEQLQKIARGPQASGTESAVGAPEVARAIAELTSRFEPRFGGFGAAPKFPPDGGLALLLQEHARSGASVPRSIVERTLDAMARGGIYDHVGGGFARYSVDDRWLVPHFEKMLYNQALLVPVYLDAWLVTAKPLYRRVVEQTLDFVRREMTDPAGGFHSSLDADSEGVEGKFYVWTPAEIDAALGAEDGKLFRQLYDIVDGGNFEGHSIPNLLGASLEEAAVARETDENALFADVAPMLVRLRAVRERRVRPATDDKVLTSWNGLMISAFARAYQVLGREEDLRSARAAADFVTARLTDGDRLLVSYREGRSQLNGYLDEYAFFGRGLVDLYESAFDPRDLDRAASLAHSLVDHFADPSSGGFYFTSDDHEQLLTRTRSVHDGALPSGAGVATELLLRLAVHLDRDDFRSAGERALTDAAGRLARAPSSGTAMLRAATIAARPPAEVVIVGAPDDAATRALLSTVRGRYLPGLVVACAAPDQVDTGLPLLAGRTAIDGRPTAYVCRDRACREPTTDTRQLDAQLTAIVSG